MCPMEKVKGYSTGGPPLFSQDPNQTKVMQQQKVFAPTGI